MKKLKKTMVTVLAAAAVLSLAACGKRDADKKGEPGTETTTEALKELSAVAAVGTTFEGNGYTVVFPENWEKTTLSDLEFVIYCTEEHGSEFTENLNILQEDLSAYGSMTLDQYAQAAMRQYEGLSGFTVINSEKRLVNGEPVFMLTSTATQDGSAYQCEQMVIVKNKTAYIVTFSGDTEGGFAGAQADAEAIMASFRVTK